MFINVFAYKDLWQWFDEVRVDKLV